MAKNQKEDAGLLMWDQLEDLPIWAVRAKEWRFHDDRKWKFDFVILSNAGWPEHQKTAIEIEGGIFGYRDKKRGWIKGGAHSSVTGILRDIEKYNHAALLGWRVLRFTPQQVLKGEAIAFIKRVLES